MITKKHYEKIAGILNHYTLHGCHVSDIAIRIVSDLADYFESDNPDFDRDKFIAAVYKESEG